MAYFLGHPVYVTATTYIDILYWNLRCFLQPVCRTLEFFLLDVALNNCIPHSTSVYTGNEKVYLRYKLSQM